MQNNTWFTIQLTEFQVVIDLTRETFFAHTTQLVSISIAYLHVFEFSIENKKRPYLSIVPNISIEQVKKKLKVPINCFSQLSYCDLFKNWENFLFCIRVEIDIAMILSSQAQIVSFKIARATYQLCSWQKILKNSCYGRFSVVLIEITNTLVKVHIYLSVYVSIYSFIYLLIYIQI